MAADITLNAGSGGAIIATDPTTSSEHYQLVKPAYGATGTFNLVSSANPLPVASASSGLVQITGTPSVISTSVVLSSAGLTQISGTVTVVSVSSGLVQISGIPTVTATAATNPWSSAPGFNLPTISVSSGLSQVSALQVSPTSSVAGAGLLVITSSFGLVTQSTQPVTITSGTITLSSNPTVISASSGLVQIAGTVTVLSASSGLVQISGVPTVTATAGTNPWSSAPGFNVPTVSVSSGLSQVSAIQVSPTSSIAGAGLLVITSSFGLVTQSTQPITITSGTVTLSSVHTVTATAGTNPWSSAPGFNLPVVSVSSGLVQISGTPTVTATAATNPWSSAPGFNVPVANASSGFVRTFNVGAVTSSGLTSFHSMSTGGAVATNITTAPSAFYGYMIFNSSAVPQAVKFYNTTGPTVGGSTANLLLTVLAPGSTGGGGANLMLPIGMFSSNGWSLIITAGMGDTDTGAPGTNTVSCGVMYQV